MGIEASLLECLGEVNGHEKRGCGKGFRRSNVSNIIGGLD